MGAKKLRVKRAYSNRKKILHIIDGRVVNFGAMGAFISKRAATTKTLADEILIDEPTQEDFKAILERGRSKFIEEYDEAEENRRMEAYEAKKAEIEKKEAAYLKSLESTKKAASTNTTSRSSSGSTGSSTPGGNA